MMHHPLRHERAGDKLYLLQTCSSANAIQNIVDKWENSVDPVRERTFAKDETSTNFVFIMWDKF